ncbi:MAG: hypothetical protein ABS87_06885 [Sphingomonas sp. SCN 67-18]|uniref:hypothetical protein n=1 Tax=uncultured Sphingomonas sp. TaxID=158754 RepID=UPI0008687EDF|nr:hypothetical protein [Sphingomonas sp. SCN 67-18]ODU21287.1 MAG: hypothetical protein ABS87_06885 [Sphingomonas sp. SCN 67-18]
MSGTEDEDGLDGAEVLSDRKARKRAKKIAGLSPKEIGVGVGIGSAAIIAALLYANHARRKN